MKTLLKRFLLIAFCITPIVVLINHSFTSKATDKPDFQNKSSKTASKSDKKIEDPKLHSPSLVIQCSIGNYVR